jgi:23S rRNA pseudouridine1911/1915/1917 synthase
MPNDPGTRHHLTVPPERAGMRLDRMLADALADAGLSRSRVQALIAEGHVTHGDTTVTDASERVKPGHTYALFVPPAVAAMPEAQAMDLVIVHEDADLLVIDKPAGMVVHPAPGNPDRTLVNALLAHCGADLSGVGGVRRPGIVHRIDKDTSGLMVVAKTDRAHRALSAQFADRSLSRTYRAVVRGVPAPTMGEIDRPIGRDPRDRKRMAVVATGKPALTRYKVVAAFGTVAALVECTLATGRTHQIRVHMAAIGHPLVGDPLYGGRARGRARAVTDPVRDTLLAFPRQALHAIKLRFVHPADGRAVAFESGLPPDLLALVRTLERL